MASKRIIQFHREGCLIRQSKEYVHFTEDELIRANETDLVSFLQIRGERLQRVGHEYKWIYHDRSGEHDSITLRGSTWYDHKNQIGGKAIKFMQEHFDLDFADAVKELLGGNFDNNLSPHIKSVPRPIEEPKEFKMPDANKDMHRVFAYLIKQRFIDGDVVSHFAHEKKLYEDTEYYNAVFVGFDENGIPRQAHKRSTTSFGNSFRQTVDGSDTHYSFNHIGISEKLFVFEAPIDMLSFITLNKANWQVNSYVALNGVAEHAMLQILKSNSYLQEVVLCVDNDEGGIEATDRLKDILRENGYKNVSSRFSTNKDWNEDLIELNGGKPKPAVEHKRKGLYLQTVCEIKYLNCDLDRTASRIWASYKNNEFQRLAEHSLSACALLFKRANQIGFSEQDCFQLLKTNLSNRYKPYTDKGKLGSKQDDLNKSIQVVMADLNNKFARTAEQMKSTSEKLYQLADCTLRVQVETLLSEQPKIEIKTKQEPPAEKLQEVFQMQM